VVAPTRSLLINGLSMGSGGGYTVGVELWRHIALARPQWNVTLCVICGDALHEEVQKEAVPDNCRLLWAPATTQGRWARMRYERSALVSWTKQQRTNAVVQLNGMVIPGMQCPTLAHCQDPWPYRPEAWASWHEDRAIAFLKRRGHARAFRKAAVVGFTSHYLRDLMCERLGVTPQRPEVIYNGLPQSWIARARAGLPDWASRPMEIVTISDVSPYKQQEMVIRALPAVLRHPDLTGMLYRIVGRCSPAYADHLRRVAAEVGVADHVLLEGRVSRQRIEELFTRSRCYVLMSKCESFGLPAVEAMTFGTPVLAADCCAIPEICGDAAVLSPMTDIHALSENLTRLLTDAALAERLRDQGVRRLTEFCWTRSAERLSSSIEDAAAAA
jgi:glycosyltransferase involved in cell wall biosynthesis